VLILVGVVERAIAGLSGKLPAYQAAFVASTTDLWDWFESFGLELPEATLSEYLNPQVLLRYLGTIAGTLGDFLTTMFIVVIVAIFVLLEGAALPAKVRDLPVFSQDTWDRMQQVAADVRRYMFLKTVMSLLTGVLVALWLLTLGVDFPILLGVLAFALNYIPAIGSIVAALPGILLAFVEFGLGTSLLVSAGYVAINVGVSNGIEPRYLGDGLGLSPLVVILSVLLWGWVLGPMGMLLSVPLTMSVKIALESDDGTRWIAILMSGRRHHMLRDAAQQLATKVRPQTH
jgi:AI-2 transport protein TqsA